MSLLNWDLIVSSDERCNKLLATQDALVLPRGFTSAMSEFWKATLFITVVIKWFVWMIVGSAVIHICCFHPPQTVYFYFFSASVFLNHKAFSILLLLDPVLKPLLFCFTLVACCLIAGNLSWATRNFFLINCHVWIAIAIFIHPCKNIFCPVFTGYFLICHKFCQKVGHRCCYFQSKNVTNTTTLTKLKLIHIDLSIW